MNSLIITLILWLNFAFFKLFHRFHFVRYNLVRFSRFYHCYDCYVSLLLLLLFSHYLVCGQPLVYFALAKWQDRSNVVLSVFFFDCYYIILYLCINVQFRFLLVIHFSSSFYACIVHARHITTGTDQLPCSFSAYFSSCSLFVAINTHGSLSSSSSSSSCLVFCKREQH